MDHFRPADPGDSRECWPGLNWITRVVAVSYKRHASVLFCIDSFQLTCSDSSTVNWIFFNEVSDFTDFRD